MPGEVVPVRLHTISIFLKFSIFFRVISFLYSGQLCVSSAALQLVSCVADVKNSNNYKEYSQQRAGGVLIAVCSSY
jgi:hypothetical protein